MDSTADTIIEIGGQDSKYIRLQNGSVVDFEMNKVCAAGTGSFLQEQADRLGIRIEEEFSKLALGSKAPVDLGTRCTVFMESDLIHHQQLGSPKADLVAGLSYSIANNYLEKVVGNKKIGQRIYFQGGVAGNNGVVAAFENILDSHIVVPEDYNVTGAIGAALIAMERMKYGGLSNFSSFDLRDRNYQIKTFECKHCPNYCEIKQVFIEDKSRAFYGGICDRYEVKEEKESDEEQLPDLFKEREEMLMSNYSEEEFDSNSPVIGIPRMLMFFEQFPLWSAYFGSLGFRVLLSDKTNRKLINKGLQEVLAETCYPVKIAYGHVVNLIEKGVDYIFIPSIIDLKKETEDVTRSYNCPFIQGIPFMLRPAFEEKVKILSPTIYMAKDRKLKRQLLKIGKELGKKGKDVSLAIDAALRAQQEFDEKRYRRGKEILETLKKDNHAVVLIGKPYNIHDVGLNLNISKKLRKLGVLAIPYDFLPLDKVELPSYHSNLVWKNEQNLLRGAMFAKGHGNLHPIMITNYGCGPDAFFSKYLEDTMEEDLCLVIEVDEHSGDAGMTTRIEAYLDTINKVQISAKEKGPEDLSLMRPSGGIDFFKPLKMIREFDRTVYIPYVSAHSTVVAAAFKSVGVDAVVLPEPNELSDELGRRHASAKECHPYLVATGDFVRMTQVKGFDPDRSAFMMLNFDGSCRLSQYAISQKLVLKRLGLEHIPIIAPITSIRHDEFTRLFGLNWSKTVWQGWLATDVLLKKLLHIRPYELNKGESDALYEKGIEEIAFAIVDGDFYQAFREAIAAMEGIPVVKEDRPIIGIVGEFYSCMNSWANNDFIKELESLGAEVRYGPSTTDYLAYFNEVYPQMYFSKRKYIASAYYYIRRRWLMGWKNRIEEMLGGELSDYRIPKVEQRVKSAAPYVSDSIDPVVTVNVSKAENYALKDCSGIANLIVLNCLYGTLCTAIYKKIQREHNRIPMLTLIYDGLKQTNEKTRIEAFVRQAKLYQERILS
ncbi:acyl-CoA dehydratase activase-related protein [Chloroflexota bacterium]